MKDSNYNDFYSFPFRPRHDFCYITLQSFLLSSNVGLWNSSHHSRSWTQMDKFYIKGVTINRNLPVPISFHLDFLQHLYDKPKKFNREMKLFLVSDEKAEVRVMTLMVLFLIMKRIQITEFLWFIFFLRIRSSKLTKYWVCLTSTK